MERYDAVVIGTGPAGISAAITLKIRNKSFLLIGNEEISMKVERAHTIMNYPGLPAISGEALREAYREHLSQMDISITKDRIITVYAMGDYFFVQGISGEYEADTVILAAGVHAAKPYPGEMEFLGRGVSYCATCDAPLYHGKKAAIIAASPKEEAEAEFMAEIAEEVLYFPLYAQEPEWSESAAGKIRVFHEKPVSIEGGRKADTLVTKEGRHQADGIFILRESVSPAQLVPGIATSGPSILVDRKMQTNLQGLFAAGDVTGGPFQYIKAAGEGNTAALSAVEYLSRRK